MLVIDDIQEYECPVCGGYDVTTLLVAGECGELWKKMECNECGAIFYMNYKFSSVSISDKETLKKYVSHSK